MKKWLFLSILSLCACGRRGAADNYVYLRDGFALGTSWNVTANVADTVGLRGAIDSLLAGVEASMSLYDPQSLLSRLNRNETDSVDVYIARCLDVARRVSELGDGDYDVTLRPVIAAWGFNAEERQEHPNVDSLLEFVGYRKIRVEDGRLVKEDPRTEIDLNSVAKGYAVDLLGELLSSRGASDYMVEVGGEIVCRGLNAQGKEWHIGIDKPVDGNLVAGAHTQASLRLGTGAIATSGNYRRFYMDGQGRRVVHTVNSHTGMARPNDMLSATVVAAECAVADAWATLLMATGSVRARELLAANPGIEAFLIYTDPDGAPVTYATPGMESRMAGR